MQGQSATPLSRQNHENVDFAARLIRVPKHLEVSPESNGVPFQQALQKQMQLENSSQIKSSKTDRRLWDACIEMESLFVGKMLKEMRKTVPKSGWINGGFAEEIFEDMLYDEYAMSLSRNSNLGLAKMLYDQLSRKV
ncbi:MAG: rod-binding protein [Spirochaetes bacterium]|nr:rod-binding protein [Spirochaetota bacterium]